MPRTARLDAPGCVHHVLLRGIESREIFVDDRDRCDFLDRLEIVVADGAAICFAWALMPNHVHLLLQTGTAPLSRTMARLNTGYATRFNLRHGRVGHLFQNRFKSILVEEEAYLQTLLRYIHRNPLRAGIVPSLEALACHPWTGHAALMGHAPRRFLAVEAVLEWFGGPLSVARARLVRWMEQARGDFDEQAPLSPGAPEYVEKDVDPAAEAALAGWDLDRLIAWVCGQLAAQEAAVRSGSRTGPESRARAAITHLAAERLGLRGVEVAAALGVSSVAVSRAQARGARIVREAGLDLLGPEAPPLANPKVKS